MRRRKTSKYNLRLPHVQSILIKEKANYQNKQRRKS